MGCVLMTIRIIDLLVKIANGEEVPKKIIFHGFEYWYEENMEDYKNAQTEYSDYIIGAKFHRTNWLNDEVELIEPQEPTDNTKIEELDKEEMLCLTLQCAIAVLTDRLNEVIRYINKEDNNE